MNEKKWVGISPYLEAVGLGPEHHNEAMVDGTLRAVCDLIGQAESNPDAAAEILGAAAERAFVVLARGNALAKALAELLEAYGVSLPEWVSAHVATATVPLQGPSATTKPKAKGGAS